jgi:DNA-binding transcriptional LysR family regulator
MDRLAAMRAFVAVVDTGSLTAAAVLLDRAPPTMVRTLAALETHLGVRLLTRTTRRMSLTEEGRVYLDRCRRILADVEEAEQAVVPSIAEPRGDIRATAPVLFGQRHVAPAVTDFLQRHAQVRVELLLLDRNIDLVDEGIDVGVRIGRLPDSSMVAVPVGHVRRVVVASPALLEEAAATVHPAELAARPCVAHSGTGSPGRWTFRDGGRDLAMRVKSTFTCNQVTAVVEACVAGLGFGCFLSYQVEPEVRAGALRVVLEAYEPEPIPVQIVYPGARLMSPRLRVFVDWLRDQLRARPALRGDLSADPILSVDPAS